jgi:hypothetical protein
VLALTASGAGSILAWAVQMTASNVALMGTLIARALPVVLLTCWSSSTATSGSWRRS